MHTGDPPIIHVYSRKHITFSPSHTLVADSLPNSTQAPDCVPDSCPIQRSSMSHDPDLSNNLPIEIRYQPRLEQKHRYTF